MAYQSVCWRVALTFYLCALLSHVATAGDCPQPAVHPFSIALSNCSTQSHDGVPASSDSWGVLIYVGNPPQGLCVSPSTVTNHTFLPSSDLCSNDHNNTLEACTDRRGGGFSLSAPGSSFIATSSMDEILKTENPIWRNISAESKTTVGNITMQFPPDISLTNFTTGIITEGQRLNVGHLGLGQTSVFLQRAVTGGYIPTEGFSINAGSQSFINPRQGHLILGGYDSQSAASPFTNYNITYAPKDERTCPFQVQIQKLELKFAGVADSAQLVGPGSEVLACIEPYDSLFRLPPSILESFTLRTGWRNDTTINPQEFLVVEPGLMFSNTTFNASIKFSLNNGFDVEIPNYELVRPLRGIAANGTRVVRSDITEVAVFENAALLNTAVLGRVFLSNVYLAVSFQEKQFRLARLAQNVTVIDPVPFHCMPASKPGSKAKIIAPAVVGCVVVVFILFIVVRRLFHRDFNQPTHAPVMIS